MRPESSSTATGLVSAVAAGGRALDAAYLLTDACAHLPGVSAAAVWVPVAFARSRVIAATDSRLFDAFQAARADLDVQDAPEPDADELAAAFPAPATQAGQWPRLAGFAAVHGIRALYAVPMRAFGILVGRLVLLSSRVPTLAADELEAAHGWAVVAAAAMLADSVANALSDTAVRLAQYRALQDQITVWQATGALAARNSTGVPAALTDLRRHAENNGQPLAHSARQALAWTPESRAGFSGQDRDNRVLLVEADPFAGRCLAGMLRVEGFEVVPATTVHAAWEHGVDPPPPVAVIDQLLPGAAEFDLDLAARGARVIALSAAPSASIPPGTVALLRRPIPPSRVVAAVRDLHPLAQNRMPA